MRVKAGLPKRVAGTECRGLGKLLVQERGGRHRDSTSPIPAPRWTHMAPGQCITLQLRFTPKYIELTRLEKTFQIIKSNLYPKNLDKFSFIQGTATGLEEMSRAQATH